MAIIKIHRVGGRPADEDGSSGKYRLRFIVQTDNALDQAPGVLANPSLPRYGDLLSAWEPTIAVGYKFRCISRRAVDTATPTTFELDCNFSTTFNEVADKDLDPLDRRARVSKSERDIEVPFFRTAELPGQPPELVLNTATDPFVPPLMTTLRSQVYTVTWNAPFLEAWMDSEKKLVNDAAVNIRGRVWPEKQLRLDSVSYSDEIWGHGVPYFKITATIIGDPRDHRRHILNDGLNELPGGVLSKKRRCRRGNEEVTAPVPLRANGEQIPEAELAADPINKPHFLDLDEFETAAFNTMIPSMA